MSKSILLLVISLALSRFGYGFSRSSFDATSNTNGLPKEKLKNLLKKANMELSDMDAETLSGPGFCNAVYKLQIKRSQAGEHRHSFVAKLFSPMAKQRMDPAVKVGHVDLLASNFQLGPPLCAETNDGILMECLNGTDLKESDVHGEGAEELCRNIAKCVAQFQAMESQSPERPHMLWYSIDAMLSLCRKSQSVRTDTTHWSVPKLVDEVKRLKDCIEKLELPLVLGHGDLKPSNIFVTDKSKIHLIDFELSGVNYRGFDVAKLFRTDHPTLYTEANRKSFIEAYVNESRGLGTIASCDEDSLLLLPLEVKLMEPLTWLEAAIFFLCLSSMDPSHEGEWKSYALDRMQSYERTKTGFDDIVNIYKSMKRQ